MSAEATARARQNRKIDLVFIHGEKCAICGYNKYIGALQFHHINPKEKDFELSNGNCRAFEDDVKESKKCILVCANCHAEIHGGLIKEELKTSFNQELYELKQQERANKEFYCQRCGIKVSYGANYCSSCCKIMLRKVERPPRDVLKEQIRNFSFLKIGEMYGVSDNSIRKWCDFYNLPRKKTEINQYSNADWEEI